MQSFQPKSDIQGITWPGLPTARGTNILALLYQLEQSQWWDPDKLIEQQFAQLNQLVLHASSTVPFYRGSLKRAGVTAGKVVTPENWRKLPILMRSNIQFAGEKLASKKLPPDHGNVGEIFTSGSTGKPIRAVQTALWQMYREAFVMRNQLWHRRDLTGTFAYMRTSTKGKSMYPEGDKADSWSDVTSIVADTGASFGLNVMTPTEQKVEWLQRRDPDYLLTHPTIIHDLARYCLDQGIRLKSLRQVGTISETLKPATREVCREAWGVSIVDVYSSREAGCLALQCPDHEHYHTQSESVYLEILNDDGEPCDVGEVGRVVITLPHNFAMPLIRYELGDYAEVGEACPCGRGLPVIKRILGRTQNMLVLPSGERRWPLLSSSNIKALLAIGPIGRYQIVQTSTSSILVRLETPRNLTPDEENSVRSWITEKLAFPFDVTIESTEEIPLSSAGKFDDFVSTVA